MKIADELFEHIHANLHLVSASDNLFISIYSLRELKKKKINIQRLTANAGNAIFDFQEFFGIIEE